MNMSKDLKAIKRFRPDTKDIILIDSSRTKEDIKRTGMMRDIMKCHFVEITKSRRRNK